MTDPLDQLLTPSLAEPDPKLRQALFQRTTRVLRRRRLQRRLGFLAAAAALFVLALVPLDPPRAPRPQPQPSAEMAQAPKIPDPPPALSDPVALEWRALENPDEAATLYRLAGDRYLERGEPSHALRCYANLLEEEDSLEVNLDDSWLLIAIKHARQKELIP